MHRLRRFCGLALLVSESLVLCTETAAGYRKQALICSQNKQWHQAIILYRKALALEPQDAETHYDLALALKYEGNSAAAIDEFTKTLQIRPEWSAAHYGLGAAYCDK